MAKNNIKPKIKTLSSNQLSNQRSKPISVSVIIPVYNEEEVITKTISAVKKVMNLSSIKEFEIIVVNDGSKDKSPQIISQIPNIIKINHPINKGYGASIKSGIRVSKFEWILILDADGTYPIADIPKLINETQGYDMVVGARTGKNVFIPVMRRPAKYILKKMTRIMTGMDIPDLNSGLRIFKKSLAEKFWTMFPDGFSFTTTITLASLTNGYSVKFIPINYFKRTGKSSINPIKDFIKFNILIFKMVIYFSPLKFFTPLSIFILILGILRGWRDYLVVNHLGELSLALVFVAAQLFFFGLLADLISKRMR